MAPSGMPFATSAKEGRPTEDLRFERLQRERPACTKIFSIPALRKERGTDRVADASEISDRLCRGR